MLVLLQYLHSPPAPKAAQSLFLKRHGDTILATDWLPPVHIYTYEWLECVKLTLARPLSLGIGPRMGCCLKLGCRFLRR